MKNLKCIVGRNTVNGKDIYYNTKNVNSILFTDSIHGYLSDICAIIQKNLYPLCS